MKTTRPLKLLTIHLVLLGLIVSFLPAQAADRGIVPIPIKDKSGNQVGLYKESHALLIGVSDYTGGWPDLPGVANDLRLVEKALEQQGFNVVVVKDPNRRELTSAFENFINRYGQTPDNRLLFYFSGHGHTLKNAYGEKEMGYIVPMEAPNPNIDERGFRASALSMQQMEVYARLIQSKHAIFLFDSCFSGSLFSLSRRIPENISYKTSRPVRQFVTAGTADEKVPDDSIFRRQFIDALQGEGDLDKDGYLTGLELGEFLQKTVVNYSNGSQHPQYGAIRDPDLDKGDFVFALFDPVTREKNIEKSIEALELERKSFEGQRLELEDNRKRLELEKRLAEAKRKLEEEKKRLVEEEKRMEIASLPPKSKPAGNAPAGMVRIIGGEYTAGLDADVALAECKKYYDKCERSWFTNETPHDETVGSFNMDKYEVRQAEYERVMGENPSYFKGANLPVESVSWHEAKAYCEKVGKRLPTEWEWEYAAKGGRDSLYPWGNKVESWKANFCDANCALSWKRSEFDDGHSQTAPVGSYPPNSYGLHDMSGNVWEWTSSDYNDNGKNKVLRGGSWFGIPSGVRSASRGWGGPTYRVNAGGFRCASPFRP